MEKRRIEGKGHGGKEGVEGGQRDGGKEEGGKEER